jgi:hypothetical protein
VLPAQHDEEELGTDDAAGEQRPHRRPEFVLGDAEAVAVPQQPEDR